jgi:hypothetical protein
MKNSTFARIIRGTLTIVLAVFSTGAVRAAEKNATMDDFRRLVDERRREWEEIEKSCIYHGLPRDIFLRYSLDQNASPTADEVVVDEEWKIILDESPDPLTELMAGHFVEFMARCMETPLEVMKVSSDETRTIGSAVVFAATGGGDPDVPESFTIAVSDGLVRVSGGDVCGLRNGIVSLVDRMAMRCAPFLASGSRTSRPRIATRMAPFYGRDEYAVFMGFNAVNLYGGSLYAISRSDAIPELASRLVEGQLEKAVERIRRADRYGLKTFLHVQTQQKFPKDDPVLLAHPEIRGTVTWKEDGEYTICTEHPLVKRYLMESVGGIFEEVPELDGIIIIIGGEGFYHCFMRPYGVEKGHTNCPRCEALGPDTVVANLCNNLAAAARKHNPEAVVLAWPYSAVHVWSSDEFQTGFIRNLRPGTGILTEVVKDEVVEKPGGIRKALWDYSIDMIGPGDRAREQTQLCHEAGIPICILSMAEGTFEASFLPEIPCMDRWMARAEALVEVGADMAYITQMGPFNGSPAFETNKLMWWEPVPDREQLLQEFAARIAGREAGPYLRNAWKYVSEAVPLVPEIGSYYRGPHYLGPAHPMIADASAEVPDVFYGYYLYYVEMTAEDALKGRPTYFTDAPGTDPDLYGRYFEQMRGLLEKAAREVDAAEAMVPERCRLMFNGEASCIRWFYRTARTESNFSKSCRYRHELVPLSRRDSLSQEEKEKARELLNSWRKVLIDERENTGAAVGLAEADCRLDFFFRGDHSFPHVTDMLHAKLRILDTEINEYLPSLAKKCGIEDE